MAAKHAKLVPRFSGRSAEMVWLILWLGLLIFAPSQPHPLHSPLKTIPSTLATHLKGICHERSKMTTLCSVLSIGSHKEWVYERKRSNPTEYKPPPFQQHIVVSYCLAQDLPTSIPTTELFSLHLVPTMAKSHSITLTPAQWKRLSANNAPCTQCTHDTESM